MRKAIAVTGLAALSVVMATPSGNARADDGISCFSCKDDYNYDEEMWYHVDYTWISGNGWKGFRHGASTPLGCSQHTMYQSGGGGSKPPVT